MTLTSKQSTAVHAYLTAWNKYQRVTAIDAGANVDRAAWENAHEAAGAVGTSFGITSSGAALEAALELLCGVDEPPRDTPSVAAAVRELVEADRDNESWLRWCERSTGIREAQWWLKHGRLAIAS